jgi:Raf kinase inhibitor-like YbhB/YbcL family protein
MPLSLTSPAFPSGGRIPVKYTRDGQNVSPPLAWHDTPEQARSFAVVVEDPDAPSGTFRHWAISNIGPGETGLRGHRQLDWLWSRHGTRRPVTRRPIPE